MSGSAPGTLYAPSIEQQAIRDRGHASNVLVAAAGSGKTRVLTWLYCDAHVREHIPLTALLAITFTDKAAGELRARIAAELEGHTLGREPDLGEAWIGTFHGVCARILREFAHRRGLDPAFGVIEELQALELQAEAWDEAVGSLLEAHGGEAASMLAQIGGAALREAIVEWWKARRSAGEVHPRLPTPVTAAADVRAAAGRLIRVAEDYAAVADAEQSARATPLATLARHLVVAEHTLALAATAQEMADADAFDPQLVDALIGQLNLIKVRRGHPMPSNDEGEAVLDARDEVSRRLAEVMAGPRVALLGELVGEFSRRYEACKRRSELLDFDDLELEALQLLREDGEVRLRLVERFERVLVDEFQDTNPRQAELVDLLAGGPMWIPVGGDGRPAVTVVGDPRQAIYGFRYADVELIAGATARIGEEGDLRLSTNYRSDAEVLTAIDEAFAKLDPGHEPVTAHRGPDHLPAGQARVELLVTKEEAGDSWDEVELGARPGERGGPSLAEARLVAARIEELRTAEPDRSIVVLARTRAALGPVAEALVDLEIPALIDGADGFWERLEVADLLAWLRLVRNPADDAALIAICASPLLGLTTDGLAAIGELPGGVWAAPRIDALRAAVDDGSEPGSGAAAFTGGDAGRLRGLLALLDRQREPGRSVDPAGLLDEVVEATRYDEHLLSLVGGDRRVANVVRLRRIATEVVAGGGDLTDVVERAEKEQGHELRAPEAAVAGSDAVTLMTVHQAKGLEFDTVIVAGLGSPQRISAPTLIGDPKPGGTRLGLRLRPSPGAKPRALFDHAELVGELQQREDDEVRRVLYVALTRARERLIVSGIAEWTASSGSPFSRDPSRTAAVLTWLGPALVPELDALIDVAAQTPQRTRGGIELRVSTPSGPALPARRRAPEVVELEVHVGDGPRPERVPARGVAPVPAPRVLSYSALAAHAACGMRFHAERVLGLGALIPDEPPAAAPQPIAMATAGVALVGDEPPSPTEDSPAPAREPRVSFASPKAAADQLDLFSFLDDPVLDPDQIAAPLPRAAPMQSGLFAGATDAAAPAPIPPAAATPVAPSPSGAAPAPGGAAVGVAVHAILERLAPGVDASELEAALAVHAPSPEWPAELRAEVRMLVARALGSAVVGELWAGGRPRRELAFTVAVGTGAHLITGVLDAWSPSTGGGALVVDYKTDRVRDGDDLERKTAERYALQRDAYALAALRAGAESVRVAHLFLRDPAAPTVEALCTAADAPMLDARLAEATEAVDDAPLAAPAPNAWLCDGCPARGTLCGWPLAMTRRPPGGPPAPLGDWAGREGGVRAA